MVFKFKAGDKVKILDGDNISGYGGGWTAGMRDYVGRTATINKIDKDIKSTPSYLVNEFGYTFDERGLEPIEDGKIIISQYGNKVVAKLDRKVGVARCNPDDEFDFYIGSKLALDRLFGKEEKEVKEVHRRAKVGEWIQIIDSAYSYDNYKNGDVLLVEKVDDGDGYTHAKDVSTGMYPSEYVVLENYIPSKKEELLNGKFICVDTEDVGLTIGRVYEFKNGFSEWDDETVLPNPDGDDKRKSPIKNIDDLYKYLSDSKFIPLVEN